MNPFVAFLDAHGRLAIPVEFAAVFYTVFVILDIHLAKSVRNRFSAYLLSARYESEFPDLPGITFAVFQSIFGSRHLSWKCARRSAACSTLALISLFTFTFLYNPTAAIATFRMNIRNSTATGTTIALFGIWIFWCLLPDYITYRSLK
jgi:hypothetical protein